MIGEVSEIRGRLSSIHPAFVGSVSADTLPPYYLLSVVPLSDSQDRAVGADGESAFDVRVSSVAGTAEGALILLQAARAELSPDGAPTALAVSGRSVEIVWARFESLHPDDSVTIPSTNRHPHVAVDSFHVASS